MQLLLSLIWAALGVSAVPTVHSARQKPIPCGNPPPSLWFLESIQQPKKSDFTTSMAAENVANRTHFTAIDVNVYLHVITETKHQRPSNASIASQVSFLQRFWLFFTDM